MIVEMLDLDRMESGKMTLHRAPVQLNLIITEVAERLRSGAPHHTLYLRLDPNLPAVVGDRDKLTQVMLNLLNNAVKYAPDGGQLVVSSAADRPGRCPAPFSAPRAGMVKPTASAEDRVLVWDYVRRLL